MGLQELYQDMIFIHPERPEYQQEWQDYSRDFRTMTNLLREKHIPLMVISFPDLSEMPMTGGMPDRPQQFLKQISDENDTLFLDMLPIFRDQGDIQSLYLMYYNPDAPVNPNAPDAAVMIYSGDGHPSPYGHLVIARAVADLLIERGFVPNSNTTVQG